jgi:hypothetical protein
VGKIKKKLWSKVKKQKRWGRSKDKNMLGQKMRNELIMGKLGKYLDRGMQIYLFLCVTGFCFWGGICAIRSF